MFTVKILGNEGRSSHTIFGGELRIFPWHSEDRCSARHMMKMMVLLTSDRPRKKNVVRLLPSECVVLLAASLILTSLAHSSTLMFSASLPSPRITLDMTFLLCMVPSVVHHNSSSTAWFSFPWLCRYFPTSSQRCIACLQPPRSPRCVMAKI